MTEECYQELLDFGIKYVQYTGNWHWHLGIAKDELAKNAIADIQKYILNYDSTKSSLKTYLSIWFKQSFNRQLQISRYQKRDKRKVVSGVLDDNNEVLDLVEHYSFKKSLERSVFLYEDKEFVSSVLLYWTLNVDDYFADAHRKYVAKKIIRVLLSGEHYRMSYTRFTRKILGITNRQAFHQVLNIMRTINRKLYLKWRDNGEI